MAKTLQFRRGNTAVLATITGANGEIFINTDTHQVIVHDGVTQGGHAPDTGANVQSIAVDVLPSFNDVYDLGASNKRWNDVYVSNSVDINGSIITASNGALTTTSDVVVGSLLADQLLLSNNAITPDAGSSEEYTGGLGVLLVNGNMDVSGDWMKVPTVTSNAVSNTGGAASFRYNLELSQFEGHNGTSWSSFGGGSSPTPSSLLSSLLTVDGSGSGLDADTLDGYHSSSFQSTLVSGSNIKTINGSSILGSGDLTVSGSSAPKVWNFDASNWQQSINSSNYTLGGYTLANSSFSTTLTPLTSGYMMVEYYPKDIYFFDTIQDLYLYFTVLSNGTEYMDDYHVKATTQGSHMHGPYRVIVPVTASSAITIRMKWLVQNVGGVGGGNYFNYGGNLTYARVTAMYVDYTTASSM